MILLQGRLLGQIYLALFGAWLLGEVVLMLKRRAKTGLAVRDRGFRALAVLVVVLANMAAIASLKFFREATFATYFTSCIGLVLMSAGLMLRWWAIVHLGRFFTVDVAVAADQHVVDSGPYRLIRHPSYAGLLLLALGVGTCFGNVASIVVILLPVIALMLKRMRIEEEALVNGLGNSYRAYMDRTKRLIPGIY
jgi:protein-S-isoprenylcysteine O-methyltransferase